MRHFRIWIKIICVVIALFCFEEVMDDVFHDPREGDYEAQTFDKQVATFAGTFKSEGLTQIMNELTALGSFSVILVLFIIFASVLISFRDFKGLAFITTVLAGAGLWPYLLKLYFKRGRPEDTDWLTHVTDSSFPSGHSFGAAAAYLGFAFYASLYAKNWRHESFFYFLGALLAAVVGVSRIYLGVHFPTDVLAGLAGGVAWGLTASLGYEILRLKHRPTG